MSSVLCDTNVSVPHIWDYHLDSFLCCANVPEMRVVVTLEDWLPARATALFLDVGSRVSCMYHC